jgi:hypothetical protein
MLATDSIDPSVKNFSFLTDSIHHQFEKKYFFSIESNQRLKIFFLLKTIDLIDVFFTVNQLSVLIQSMFFSAIGAHLCYAASSEVAYSFCYEAVLWLFNFAVVVMNPFIPSL